MPNWVIPAQPIAALAKLHAQSGLPGDEKTFWCKAESTVFEKIFAGEIQTFVEKFLYIWPFGPEHRENYGVTPQFCHTWQHTADENRIPDWVTGDLRIYSVMPNGGKTLQAQVVGLRLDSDTIPWSIDPTPGPSQAAKFKSAPSVGDAPLQKSVLPPDDEIVAKIKELIAGGLTRDQAVIKIRTEPGFEAVQNEHARRVVRGQLTLGRPRKKIA